MESIARLIEGMLELRASTVAKPKRVLQMQAGSTGMPACTDVTSAPNAIATSATSTNGSSAVSALGGAAPSVNQQGAVGTPSNPLVNVPRDVLLAARQICRDQVASVLTNFQYDKTSRDEALSEIRASTATRLKGSIPLVQICSSLSSGWFAHIHKLNQITSKIQKR